MKKTSEKLIPTRSLFNGDDQMYVIDAKSFGNVGRFMNVCVFLDCFLLRIFVYYFGMFTQDNLFNSNEQLLMRFLPSLPKMPVIISSKGYRLLFFKFFYYSTTLQKEYFLVFYFLVLFTYL